MGLSKYSCERKEMKAVNGTVDGVRKDFFFFKMKEI